MIEETKSEIIGRRAKTLDERVEGMTWENLQGESNRMSKNPRNLLDGCIADILLTVFFKTHNKGNDPYMLELNRRDKKNRGFEIREESREKTK